tara:strand:+ start:1936 stop:3138 length:1203 start_codon:yes stop_codon:yes gene_type:complete
MKLSYLIFILGTIFSSITGHGSEPSSPDRPITRDENGCLMIEGFSWCEDTQSCIRISETPCRDSFTNCRDCLYRQRLESIACPPECDMVPIEEPSEPCSPCPPPTPCPPPGPDCFYSSPDIDECGCTEGCGRINCMPYPSPPPEETLPPPPQPDPNPCPIQQPDCNGYNYVCPKITEITHCSEGGIVGYTTYQLSVLIKDHNYVKNIYALFGESSAHEMYLPPAYQIDGPFNSDIGGVSPSIIQIFPDSLYDSWITIDITDGDPDNRLSTIGIDFNEWSETKSISTSNGAIFKINPNGNNYQNEYLLGQITLPNYINEVVTMNIQGRKVNDDSWKEYSVTFPLNPSELIQNPIPLDCILWYDGCNLCQVTNGNLGLCTSNMCLEYGDTLCHAHSHTQPGH